MESWKDEFFTARTLGFDFIEWVFDVESSETTPLLCDIQKINDVQASSSVCIGAVCGDYFRDRPIFRADKSIVKERLTTLERLAKACETANIATILLPFVDNSAINGDLEFSEVMAALKACLPIARDHGLQFSLETNLAPDLYRKLMGSINDPALKVNYDIGDCVSLGHDPVAEIDLLGPWIAGFHVKDRKRGGTTVPLGAGDVNFLEAFTSLAVIGYKGPITLQAARSGDEIHAAKKNLTFVRGLLDTAKRTQRRSRPCQK